jgi:hypothetical protein
MLNEKDLNTPLQARNCMRGDENLSGYFTRSDDRWTPERRRT